MADCDTSYIKNIVLPGHAGSGRTTLAESCFKHDFLLPV